MYFLEYKIVHASSANAYKQMLYFKFFYKCIGEGPYTNHVDHFLDFFDPPYPLVDSFTK